MGGRIGTLHLVVGPSGAGKDTLMAAALSTRPDVVLLRRAVTRPAGSIGEDHIPVDAAEFAEIRDRGAFALHWSAHGLFYGLPAEPCASMRADGRHVLANVSRRSLDEARARLSPVRVLHVTASLETLAARLAARGRETADDVAERLARAPLAEPVGPDVYRIGNDGSVADGAAAFAAALAPPISR